MELKLDRAFDGFEKNYVDVNNLFAIHGDITGGIQGQGRNVTPSLLRSSVVLMCAAWEAFIEDVCIEGIELLINSGADPKVLPNGIKTSVGETLKAGNALDAWSLAADGWKSALKTGVEQKCDRLNSPKYKNIEGLVHQCFGIRELKRNWTWQKMSADTAARKLDQLVEL
jgi:hypothetical protein